MERLLDGLSREEVSSISILGAAKNPDRPQQPAVFDPSKLERFD